MTRNFPVPSPDTEANTEEPAPHLGGNIQVIAVPIAKPLAPVPPFKKV